MADQRHLASLLRDDSNIAFTDYIIRVEICLVAFYVAYLECLNSFSTQSPTAPNYFVSDGL